MAERLAKKDLTVIRPFGTLHCSASGLATNC